MQAWRKVGLMIGLLAAGCADKGGAEPQQSPPPTAAEPNPPGIAVRPAGADVVDPPEKYVAVRDTLIYLAPRTDQTVVNPYGPGTTSNLVGGIARARSVRVSRLFGAFAEVLKPDGTSGWAELADLQPWAVATRATNTEDTENYASPGWTSPEQPKIPAGTLFFVLERGGDYDRVQLPDGSEAWVRAAALSSDNDELAVSEVISAAERTRQAGGSLTSLRSAADVLAERHPNAVLLKNLRELSRESAASPVPPMD
jgi:hypothetical protein